MVRDVRDGAVRGDRRGRSTRVDASGGVDAESASGGRTEAKPLTAVEMNTLRVEDHNPAGLLNAAHVRMPRQQSPRRPRYASRDVPPSSARAPARMRAPAPTPARPPPDPRPRRIFLLPSF